MALLSCCFRFTAQQSNPESEMKKQPDEPEFLFDDLGQTMHDLLHTICRHLPTDFEPYGKRVRTGSDCSCGCRHFLKLPGDLAYGWCVCINARSQRSGLLTFEHQGCEFFEAEPDEIDLRDNELP
jgi:hypothetical protein